MKKHFKFFATCLGLIFFSLFIFQSFIVPEVSLSIHSIASNIEPISLAMSGVAFADVNWDPGDNMGGFTTTGYLILLNEVATFPTKTAEPTTDAQMIEIRGNYVMKPTKKAYSITWFPNTAGATSDVAGEPGSQCFNQVPKVFVKGTKTAQLAFATKINNQLGILLLRDPNTRELNQFGCEDFPLVFKANTKHGENATDKRGLEIEGQAYSIRPAYIYKGTLPLTPAT